MVPVKYLYILSQRYSGSTLLSFLLATHPEIATIGERRKFFVKSIRPTGNTGLQCSCGLPFTDCPFWNQIRDEVLAQLPHAALRTNASEFQLFPNRYLNRIGQELLHTAWLNHWPFRDMLFAGKLKQLNHFNRVLVNAILQLEGKKIFLDSSKNIEQALFLSRIREFDLHIIWLSRDPRAQVASALKYNRWSIEEATRRWRSEMDRNQRILSRMNVKYKELTYEALCRDPQAEMEKILHFAGIDPEGSSLDFREYEQHIMGNYSMRLGKDTKIEERRDWLERLSPDEISRIENLTEAYRAYYTNA
jgi:LPS sulfotransferase NodH